MNAPIVRLFAVMLLLFALLVAWTSRWTVLQQEELQDNANNRRGLLEELRVPRGPIRDRDGAAIARSVERPDGTYQRRYPLGNLFGHPVGYSFATLGRTGLEQEYNDELLGKEDAVSTVLDQIVGKDQIGNELRTTLDAKAQRVAIQALGGRRGAVVALEPQTGKVRVMASEPEFDANELREESSLDAIPEGGAVNRATQGQYPPGSTFKVVTTVAAIDTGRYTKDSMISGKSPKVISGTPLSNSHGAQFGNITLTEALTKSVNTVFGTVGEELGGDTMQEYMERFGFSSRVEIDLPAGERASSGVRIPGRERFVKVDDRRVDVGRVAIGQGGLLATPLQMAQVASAVANGGELMKPQLGDRIVDREGRTVEDIEPESLGRVMKASTAQEVGDMMAGVVREGTGTAAALQGVSVAGKTGTAERNVQTDLNQPWFIAFAPRENPKIAIAATIEESQGGQGGTVAAPIAKAVLEELLR
ncbi:MAG TPA: penicillin-binding protein 2 [Solirubrobacteraceae bacterium]|nr:penicillin-binding protein 2 [Solirubrobacteraceae bacterium]